MTFWGVALFPALGIPHSVPGSAMKVHGAVQSSYVYFPACEIVTVRMERRGRSH